MSDFSGHAQNNPPVMSLKDSAARPAFNQFQALPPGDAVASKSTRSPKSMDISSIISQPQSTWQQTLLPIDTSDSVTVSLPSPPDTSVPTLLTNRNSPACDSTINQDSTAHKTPSTSPVRLFQMAQPPPRKRSLSPPIRTFNSEGGGAPTPVEESDRGRPRKFWKSATGHRRGITVSGMISITAPTNYRRTPTSISRPHTSASPTSSRKVEAMTPGVVSDTPSTSAVVQSSSLSPARQTESPFSPEGDKEDFEDEEGVRDDSADSEGYLITTEDGRVVSISDSPAARKRRQNTIAARRSRQRKLEYVRTLERKVENLGKERDELRTRCEKAEEKVQWLREMIVEGRGGGGSRSDHGMG